MYLKKIQSWLALFILAFFLTACDKNAKLISLSGKTMGTTYHIKYIDNGKPKIDPQTMQQQIDTVLQDVNNKMSTYQKDSELSRFNQNTTVNTPIAISQELATVMKEAIRLNKVTDGALDVTIGPMVNLWGFGPEKRVEHQPLSEQLAERKNWIGIDKINLMENDGQWTLSKSVPQVYIDLSSIAKGYGVDVAAEALEKQQIDNYLVEIGGELRTKGHNIENKDWQIAIEKPMLDGSRAIEQVIGLSNMAMATSGNYRIYFEENGKRFAHEIDPKTGFPIHHHLASITVLSPTSMTADGLSTGLFVLGEERALAIAEKNNIAVYLIIKTNDGFKIKMSSAFKTTLEQK
ncbi:thiamine biosynthesis lipoprotein [Cricetibacter osteomyelitidis]|uniref:FAD:protein FMN transferase n=1 Tax=Cricetibacter osteomyelitidis TaxID=1521931 RepID=A0A4R2SWH7_9PAST|nr:FAD:protein FMN transferase [Cricetibacter osteomyelitidis]TCP93231.1 thiamine biosynthesis lipoprotein [Cricetibacter osteomyelitidis]